MRRNVPIDQSMTSSVDAGHASLPWPGEPHLDLWHSLTLAARALGRCGHFIALQVACYSGCDAMVMTQAMGDAAAAFVATRAWTAGPWAEVVRRPARPRSD